MKKQPIPCSFCCIDGGHFTCFGCFGILRSYLGRRRRELKREHPEYWFPQDPQGHPRGDGPRYWLPKWPEPELRQLPADRPSSPSQNASEQLQSWFLSRIPVELRLLIWGFVMGEDVLHLDLGNGILRCASCREEDERKLGFKHQCWQDAIFWSQFERAGYHWLLNQEPAGRRTNLLLTCKLISNTFDFRRSIALSRLPRVILPHRFQAIRSMSLSTVFQCPTTRWDVSKVETVSSDKYSPPDNPHDWLKACRGLATMTNMHDLGITLVFWGSYPLLTPLKAVSAEKFSVTLSTTLTDRAESLLGPVGFMILRV
ncbi:hypothetical protein AC579_4576 [Pseudocercospora musae]|uniref:DUF7730 domain-containing protein n=1 Tax=Pseudocercospora musae TaxID=113226 RepID=A0A139IU27_9PEZI|nr:hypothetical protein AC579_4576 [Pseudocercospora musae]